MVQPVFLSRNVGHVARQTGVTVDWEREGGGGGRYHVRKHYCIIPYPHYTNAREAFTSLYTMQRAVAGVQAGQGGGSGSCAPPAAAAAAGCCCWSVVNKRLERTGERCHCSG